MLSREADLDGALDALPRAAASAALFEAIVASAPPVRRRRKWRLWLAPAGLGAGLAAVAAAGVMLGVEMKAQAAAGAESSQSIAVLDVSAVSEVG